jgi:hypothetical protein
MLSKLYNGIGTWFVTNAFFIFVLSLIVIANVGYYLMPKTSFNGEFKDGIQNHLLWSVKGECYFSKPLNQTDVLLVRVNDCDKVSK